MATIEFKVKDPSDLISPDQFMEYYADILMNQNLKIEKASINNNLENNTLTYTYKVKGLAIGTNQVKLAAYLIENGGKIILNEDKVTGIGTYIPTSIKIKRFF